jgi:pyruvate formate lyase activating enzyme
MKACINNIIPFSAVDGEGNRMIVFFQGCNFKCLYCHNPETIAFGNVATYTEGLVMTPEDIVAKAKDQMPFIRGVTLSGGECTASFEFLLETVRALKDEGIHVLVDTNGFIDQEKLRLLANYADGFMLDIKAIDPEEHSLLTGVSNELVLASFETLVVLDKLVEVRTVILGNLVDSRATVDCVSKMIADKNKTLPYKLIKFRKHGISQAGENLIVPGQDTMEELKQLALSNGLVTVLTL